jgi:GLPGLI family protein
MLKTIITALAITLAYATHGQNTSGHILYTETIKLKLELDGMGTEEMKAMIPPAQVVKKELAFTANESLFKNAEKPKDIDISHEEEGGQFNIVMQVPESIVYMNLSDKTFLQSQDLLGKHFLIKDNIDAKKWKMTGEQKKVLDYNCQKAILIDSIQKTVVWFTPQIPVGIGPNGLTGVPGLILAVEMDNGDRTIVATSVQLKSIDASSLDKPSKGKEVSRKEFKKIREEKMKEMGATDGGGTGVKMIIREERH